jgi:hypothetical protein
MCTFLTRGVRAMADPVDADAMRRAFSVPELSPLVRSRSSLRQGGWTDRAIAGAVDRGDLITLRRGSFLAATDAELLWPEGRHLAHLIAVTRDSGGGAVASHESAGVLWGLPLYRHRPERVHLTTPAPIRISSGPDVRRHVAPVAAGEVIVRSGIRCTSLARTVFDIIRTVPLETAIACADAAERHMALRGREWDQDAVLVWRQDMRRRLVDASGARGIRQARWVFDFSDGRAQLPGESISRLRLFRLGFARPQLQVPMPSPTRRHYFVDFGLEDVRAFGEFDGQGKYTDEALRRGIPLQQVLLEEKRREDWIRGTTQWRFVRGEDEHIVSTAALGRRLASFGIRPPS